MKKILITGANSYIGTSFEKWVSQPHYANQYAVDTLNMRNGKWKEKDFSSYDVVFHVAGIAHKTEKKNDSQLYYKINRDLSYEVAKKAKEDEVSQYIFISSMSIYGVETGIIDINTIPNPKSHYGKSKLQAENLISELGDINYKIVILRPPMVYGKGCKGNYNRLSRFAQRLPLFPDIDNKRSMLYIGNLCEFVRLIIENGEKGIYFPQNEEYVTTSEIARTIAELYEKKMSITKIFNPFVRVASQYIRVINKVFGSLTYEKSMSIYKEIYWIRNFKESIIRTESRNNNEFEI